MRKRSGKPLPKKGSSTGSIKRFLAVDPDDPEDMDGLGRSPRGVSSSTSPAPRHRPERRHCSPASSACTEEEDIASRHSGVAALVSDLPTKTELASMLLSLERAIKKEVSAVRSDLSQVIERVEESEQRLDRHAAAIGNLQSTTRTLAIAHRMALYKIEDQENRNRRNNIRIRGLPEATGDEDLLPSIRGIFNGMLGQAADYPLKIDRVHRALRPRNLSSDTPRNVICQVHYYDEKELIMKKAKEAASLDFDGAILSFYPDLARETLERRRALRPLTEKLQAASIKYRWGFPAALIASRDGKTAILRFPEDLEKFCMDVNIIPPELPGWQEATPALPNNSEPRWQKVDRKHRTSPAGSSPLED